MNELHKGSKGSKGALRLYRAVTYRACRAREALFIAIDSFSPHHSRIPLCPVVSRTPEACRRHAILSSGKEVPRPGDRPVHVGLTRGELGGPRRFSSSCTRTWWGRRSRQSSTLRTRRTKRRGTGGRKTWRAGRSKRTSEGGGGRAHAVGVSASPGGSLRKDRVGYRRTELL
eukprot:1185003-Prorocentrum_minimum.AAC.2